MIFGMSREPVELSGELYWIRFVLELVGVVIEEMDFSLAKEEFAMLLYFIIWFRARLSYFISQ